VAAVSVGIFGGAFDPPHLGHVELARVGIEQFALGRLLVRVVEQPGHKAISTHAAIRLRLAELAFAPLPEAEVSLDPFARTVDSLEELALPDPVFLVGADEFASFLDWKEPDEVLEHVRLGVGSRPGYPREQLDAVRARLRRPERVELFDIGEWPIASRVLRAGETLDERVPRAVAELVQELGLYDRRGSYTGGRPREEPEAT
jgi:nicotinate-nucleotide adenylyltransferase